MSVFEIKNYVSSLPDFENSSDDDINTLSEYLHENPNELSTIFYIDASYNNLGEEDQKLMFEFLSKQDDVVEQPPAAPEETQPVSQPSAPPIPSAQPIATPPPSIAPQPPLTPDISQMPHTSLYDFADTVAAPQFKGNLDPFGEPIPPGKAEILSVLF